MKKSKVRDRFIEELERTPIISIVCEKVGISRNTYYRWLNEDKLFEDQVNKSLGLGVNLVSDFAEGNVLNGIRNNDFRYTKFWLEHRHPIYRKRLARDRDPYASLFEEEQIIQLLAKAKEKASEWMKGWTEQKKDKEDKKSKK